MSTLEVCKLLSKGLEDPEREGFDLFRVHETEETYYDGSCKVHSGRVVSYPTGDGTKLFPDGFMGLHTHSSGVRPSGRNGM